jgi:hypothetical protein
MTAKDVIERLEQAASTYAQTNRRATEAIVEKDNATRDYERKRAALLNQSIGTGSNISREQREAIVACELEAELDAIATAKDALNSALIAQFDAKMEWLCSREVAQVWLRSQEVCNA